MVPLVDRQAAGLLKPIALNSPFPCFTSRNADLPSHFWNT